MKFRAFDRSLHKTLAFAAIHLLIAVTLGYAFTGSFILAGALALVEPSLNTVVHHRFDRWWERRGLHGPRAALAKSALFGLAHLVIAVSLGWLLTGSFVLASAYALVEPLANTVAHFGFERWWARRTTGVRPAALASAVTAA